MDISWIRAKNKDNKLRKQPSLKKKIESKSKRSSSSCLCCCSSAQEPVPEPKDEPTSSTSPIKTGVKWLTLGSGTSGEQEEFWRLICPPGDKNTDQKLWLRESLEALGDKKLKVFQQYLWTAEKSKDGFKPIAQIRLKHANSLDTVDLMLQTYSTNSKKVAQTILEKMEQNKDKSKPEGGAQSPPASPTENELNKMLSNFVKKLPEQTLTPLCEALVSDKVLKQSEKTTVLQENRTKKNKASGLAEVMLAKGPEACQKMIDQLQNMSPGLGSELSSFFPPAVKNDGFEPEVQSEIASVIQTGLRRLISPKTSKDISAEQKQDKVSSKKDESWSLICPEGDKDFDVKCWLKEELENLDSKEMKYFHWFLQTANSSKDGFKPIKKSRLEHADILDTVDLMFQTYSKKTRDVAEGIFKKINKNKGHELNEVNNWLLDCLEELDEKELKYFHWYLQTADKSNDGFPPIKKSRLEKADRLDTVELMVNMYTTKTKEVTGKVLEKMESNKDVEIPEVSKMIEPSSPYAAEEKEVNRMLNDFVKKVSGETLTQMLEALESDKVLKMSEKEKILQNNHTRINIASCFVDLMMEKGGDGCRKVIERLENIDPKLSADLLFPDESTKGSKFSANRKRKMSEEESECWRLICPEGDRDIVLKHWLKESLYSLSKRELKYFHWYLRVADETKDGYGQIKKCRLKHAKALDTVDLMLQKYSPNTREVTEKILEKIQRNRAQHWILDLFEDLGDKELRLCQMVLEGKEKLKDSVKSVKSVPKEDAEQMEKMNLMLQMCDSGKSEDALKLLKQLKESTDEGDEDREDVCSSPSTASAKRCKIIFYGFIKKASNETLVKLLHCLVSEKVLKAPERKLILEANHTRVNKASCLVEIILEKGTDFCNKVIHDLQILDPLLFSEIQPSQQGLTMSRLMGRLKEDK